MIPISTISQALRRSCLKKQNLSVSSIRSLSSTPTRKNGTVPPVAADDQYDIVVSGGGMVGFAMACALGQSPKLQHQRVLLLEGAPDWPWKLPEEYSNRVCALSGQTHDLFQKLGIWDNILKRRAHPVKRMQVWESCSEAMICFDEAMQQDVVAHIVENDVILQAIKEQVPGNVEVAYGSKVVGYSLPEDCSTNAVISLASGRTLSAGLLIGADGAKSLVRKTMGSQYLSWEYDQMGIVATLQLAEPMDNTVAWQRFLPSGPIALLPLSEDKSSLVWSTTRNNAKALMGLSDEDFTESLNRAMWDDVGTDPTVRTLHQRWVNALSAITPSVGAEMRQLPPSINNIIPGSRGAFPLGLGHAVQYVAPRVALIGDAAHRVHPLAGQGVNLGFGDVACLTKALESSILMGCDIGDVQELYEYESERQKHNIATMAAIDGLHRLYSTTATPIVLFRSIGLSTVNALTPLKRFIMKQAES